jgi:hypothetical protein
MKYFWYLCLLLSLIFAVDLALAHLQDWVKRRKRARDAEKWGMAPGAFKPTKANSWWEA